MSTSCTATSSIATGAPMKKIALIDDEQDVLTYLGTVLDDNGFAVSSAQSCREGLELLRGEPPDLICLDLLLPDASGLSLYRSVRADQQLADVPVLLISGLALETDLDELLAGLPPPEATLEKPVDVEQLLAIVSRLLDNGGEGGTA